MKKIVTIIMIVLLIGCGKDSKEAKELLARILYLVGIPQEMVINICQDSNNNGICETIEFHKKIVINRGDDLNTIWEKIVQNPDGTYFLDNYDPKNSILLELQNTQKVRYNNGKFTLVFNSDTNGVSSDHNNTPTKELSILQSMVDLNYLSLSDTVEVKKVDVVEQFYSMLLNSLMENINILGDNNISSEKLMELNLKEMADELLANGIEKELPDRINGCNGDEVCINEILDSLSNELKISDEEAQAIKDESKKENSDPSTSSNGTKYDMWNYFIPSTSRTIISKEFETEKKNGKENLIEEEYVSQEDFQRISDTKAISTTEDGATTTYTLENNKIVFDEYDEDAEPMRTVTTFTRNASVGDTILSSPPTNEEGFSISNFKCIVSNYFSEITIYNKSFNDLLEVTCSYDVVYEGVKSTDINKAYFQKNNGVKAEVDRSCYVSDYKIDDSSATCLRETFSYILYE